MAIVRVSFFSNALMRTVPFMAVLPNDGAIFPGQEPSFTTGPMRTLYLLHGYMGDETDYLANTRIRELSEKYRLAVIMPAGENSFYLDDEEGIRRYGTYIGEELVMYTRRLFHLSERREDTFLGGLSMGGYGAMRNGIRYCETFSRVCAFSGAYLVLRIVDAGGEPFTDPFSGPVFQRRTFGDLKKLGQTDRDPRTAYLQKKAAGAPLPAFFMTVGSEDFLLDVNHTMRDFLRDQGADLTWIEDSGVHDWDFWNRHLEEAISWLVS